MIRNINLSVVLATFNEQENLAKCLESVKDLADEIVIVDGSSTDKTAEIAKKFGARIKITKNQPMFHINKQKAVDLAQGGWILQLDADEIVTKKLAEEITKIIAMDEKEIAEYEDSLKNKKLFLKHQKQIEARDGKIGDLKGSYNAFFVPRLNFFLGKYLKHGGVYPDGVIRLIKKDQAYLPCKNVHEQMVVKGRVGWLENDLIHMSDPTFDRYLKRNSRYIDLLSQELRAENLGKNLTQFFNFCFLKPLEWFFLTTFRHKGILDGYQGLIFSFFSALRFPRAYFRYLNDKS